MSKHLPLLDSIRESQMESNIMDFKKKGEFYFYNSKSARRDRMSIRHYSELLTSRGLDHCIVEGLGSIGLEVVICKPELFPKWEKQLQEELRRARTLYERKEKALRKIKEK